MSTRSATKEAGSSEARASQKARVLLMSENDKDLGTCRALVRLPDSQVETCSSYVELMLRLEHEAYELVIIFEGEKSSPGWEAAVSEAAVASKGTPVLFFKRP